MSTAAKRGSRAPVTSGESPRRPRLLTQIGLAPKLVASTVFVLAAVSFTLSVLATSRLAAQMSTSFQSKGEAIAIALATASEQSVETDISSVQGSIDANKVILGVKYIYVTDSRGHPYVHTFSPVFPAGMEARNIVAIGEDLGGRRVKVSHEVFGDATGSWRSIDVAAPVAGGILGTVHVGMDEDLISTSVADLRETMLKWAGGVALAGIAASLLVTIFVVIRPIRELTRVSGDIVRRGDLTQKIQIDARDEIGELATTFGQMVTRLREIPREIAASTRLLAGSVADLRAFADAQGATVARHATALEQTRVTAQTISSASVLAARKAVEVVKEADRADSAGRIGERAIKQSLDALKEIRARVDDVAQRTAALIEHTAQIAQVTQTVKELSDQSNRLAAKAGAEAIRAGEQGRGFRAVANEIRGLADQSIEETHRVRKIVEDVSVAVRATVAMTKTSTRQIDIGLTQVKSSGDKLAELSIIVKENAEAVREIGAAVDLQNTGIGQIFGAINAQSSMMNETVERLAATDAAVQTLSEVSEKLVTLVEGFRF